MKDQTIHTKNKLDEGLLFKISRFKEKIKKTSPHKHDDYYELIFLSEGEGFHWIETEKYMVSTPEFYFLKPGQLHYWQFTSIPKGFVILFKADFFDNLKETDIINLYHQLIDKFRISVPENYKPEPLLDELFQAYTDKETAFSMHIIHGSLRVLFAHILQLTVTTANESIVTPSIFEKFQNLLVKECPRLHKVNDFASLLNTTPQNLSAICRKHTGKSASEIISLQLLLEAKRYILHTDITINEIAYNLSFNDPSNFVKYFKKAEGLTPVQFRGKYFQ
jgi:AraC-like DNA-binding protein/quercetin dioxygenase-like cupin family protein